MNTGNQGKDRGRNSISSAPICLSCMRACITEGLCPCGHDESRRAQTMRAVQQRALVDTHDAGTGFLLPPPLFFSQARAPSSPPLSLSYLLRIKPWLSLVDWTPWTGLGWADRTPTRAHSKDLCRRIRKIPGVPLMNVARGKYVIERLPGAPH